MQTVKPALTHAELTDVIDLSLWAGQLLLQHGAETAMIEETIHRMGTALGCDWMDIFISPSAVVVTAISGGEFRTKVRRVTTMGVNMSIVAGVNALNRRVVSGDLRDRAQIRAELEALGNLKSHYPRWLVIVMVGLACAAFSRLFGGDLPVFIVTFIASSVAMIIRGEFTRHYYNPLLITIATALTAGLIAGIASRFDIGAESQIALASSVLLLVPGVHLINSVEDLIKGHLITGIARGVIGLLISLAIALGLLLAMQLTGARL